MDDGLQQLTAHTPSMFLRTKNPVRVLGERETIHITIVVVARLSTSSLSHTPGSSSGWACRHSNTHFSGTQSHYNDCIPLNFSLVSPIPFPPFSYSLGCFRCCGKLHPFPRWLIPAGRILTPFADREEMITHDTLLRGAMPAYDLIDFPPHIQTNSFQS